MAETIVRAASAQDVDAIVALQRLIHAEHLAGDPLRWQTSASPAAAYPAWLLGLMETPTGGTVLVALREAVVVGYLIAELEPESTHHWNPAAVYLHDVFVLPAHRRAGVARQLLDGLAVWHAKHHPAIQVRLMTAAHNEPARRFFASLGFRPAAVEMIAARIENDDARRR